MRWGKGCLDSGSAVVIGSGSVVGVRKDGEGPERTSKADDVSEMKTPGGMEKAWEAMTERQWCFHSLCLL